MPKVEISLLDILRYVGDRSRPLKEGEAVFKAGHIILCGLKRSNLKIIQSLCLQTSALNSPPHEVELHIANEVENWKCSCSCKAGQSGFCKHIVGTLIYINRHEDLEVLSCTDVTQMWGKEKKGLAEMYDQTGIENFWCHRPKKENFTTNENLDKRNFNRLVYCQSSSSLFKLKERTDFVQELSRVTSQPGLDQYLSNIIENANSSLVLEHIDITLPNLEDCCKELIKHLGKCDQLKIAKEYSQKSDMWKQERQLRITGSRCYSIFTFAKVQEWEKKAVNYFFPKDFSSKYTNHGIHYEAEALDNYKRTNNCQIITPCLIICKKFPWLAYSPDGVVIVNGKPSILVEIKCPYSGINTSSHDLINTCDYLIIEDDEIGLKKKHAIYGQIQFGMALLNLNKTHLLIYSTFSKSYIEVSVDLDEKFAKLLIQTVSEKYLHNMLHAFCKNKEKYI